MCVLCVLRRRGLLSTRVLQRNCLPVDMSMYPQGPPTCVLLSWELQQGPQQQQQQQQAGGGAEGKVAHAGKGKGAAPDGDGKANGGGCGAASNGGDVAAGAPLRGGAARPGRPQQQQQQQQEEEEGEVVGPAHGDEGELVAASGERGRAAARAGGAAADGAAGGCLGGPLLGVCWSHDCGPCRDACPHRPCGPPGEWALLSGAPGVRAQRPGGQHARQTKTIGAPHPSPAVDDNCPATPTHPARAATRAPALPCACLLSAASDLMWICFAPAECREGWGVLIWGGICGAPGTSMSLAPPQPSGWLGRHRAVPDELVRAGRSQGVARRWRRRWPPAPLMGNRVLVRPPPGSDRQGGARQSGRGADGVGRPPWEGLSGRRQRLLAPARCRPALTPHAPPLAAPHRTTKPTLRRWCRTTPLSAPPR